MTEQNQNEDLSKNDREAKTDLDDIILSIDEDSLTEDVGQSSSKPTEIESTSKPIDSEPTPALSSPPAVMLPDDDLVEDDLVEPETYVEQDDDLPQETSPTPDVDQSVEASSPQPDAIQEDSSSSAKTPEPTPPAPAEAANKPQVAVYDLTPTKDAVAQQVRVAGIDLGTTYSAISTYSPQHNRVETLSLNKIAEGQTVVPSVVYYPQGGDPATGTSAVNMKNAEPDRVVEAVKRAMGTDWKKTIDDRVLTAEDVSGDILRAVHGEALRVVGEEEKRVVITVPAHFEDPHNNATREAGKAAGLDVLYLLPEPHAAALAFTVERVAGTVEAKVDDLLNRYLMVFDLGGGTLDVAMIRIVSHQGENGQQTVKFETIFKDGERRLGGLDWDKKLEELVLEKYRQEIGDDQFYEQTSNEQFHAMIQKNIEQAKRSLSQLEKVKVPVMYHSIEITRTEFETATEGLLLRCEEKLKAVLQHAEDKLKIEKEKIPVVMAGGSTLMPQIPAMIEKTTGSKPLESSNPHLLVTTGAAYWAHLLVAGGGLPIGDDGGLTLEPTGIVDTVNYSVGVKTLDKDENGKYTVPIYTEIIPPRSTRGSMDETMETQLDNFLEDALKGYRTTGEWPKNNETTGIFAKVFYKSQDKMERIPIVIYSSEEPKPTLDCAAKMGDVYIMGLPADGKKGQAVLIALGHDADGILRGRSIDVESGIIERIYIDREKQTS